MCCEGVQHSIRADSRSRPLTPACSATRRATTSSRSAGSLALTRYPETSSLTHARTLSLNPITYLQSYNELKDGVAAGSTLGILVDFLYLFVASLALGMLFGLGTAFLLKFLHSDSSPQEARTGASCKNASRGQHVVHTM